MNVNFTEGLLILSREKQNSEEQLYKEAIEKIKLELLIGFYDDFKEDILKCNLDDRQKAYIVKMLNAEMAELP